MRSAVLAESDKWPVVPLGHVCREDRQHVLPGSPDASQLPYIGLDQIESETGVILLNGLASPEEDAKSNTFRFDDRHVLYAKLRPYLNKVALPSFAGRCTTEAIPLLPDPNLDRGYLAWFLRRPETVARIMAEKIGSRMPRADIEKLLGLQIPFPPIHEQRRISCALDSQMAAVTRAREYAEAQRRNVSALLQRMLQGHFQSIRPLAVDSIHDLAPRGWQWRNLGDLARLESGHTPSRRRLEWWGGDVPWIALPDIRALDGRTAFETIEQTNELGLANSSARLLPIGTVVLSRTASVGFVTVMGRPMATSQDFVNWVCREELEPWFLAYLLIACRDHLRELASGAIHKTIYVPTVEAFRICLPVRAEQHRIVNEINDARKVLARVEAAADAQMGAISELPPALLRAAFVGAP